MILERERVIIVAVIDWFLKCGTLFSVFIEALDTRDNDCIELNEIRNVCRDETSPPAGPKSTRAACEDKTSKHGGVDANHDFEDECPLSGLIRVAEFKIRQGLGRFSFHPSLEVPMVGLYLHQACIGLSCTGTEVV